jgi:hypothetical protein
MYINEIGDIVNAYEEIQKLDLLIEAAKDGKFTVSINGKNMGDDMAEACMSSVVSYLRTRRSFYTHQLLQKGFEE